MSKYPVRQMKDEPVWSHVSVVREWMMLLGGRLLQVWSDDDCGFSCHYCDESGFYHRPAKCTGHATFDAAEAALLAVVEAADKPEWIDAKSGLAAMCEWRGWTLTVGQCTNGNGWWFHVTDGSGGGADADKFVNLTDAELAAEAWVREQTGKGETT